MEPQSLNKALEILDHPMFALPDPLPPFDLRPVRPIKHKDQYLAIEGRGQPDKLLEDEPKVGILPF